VLQKGQIHVGNQAVIDHLDAYSAPRLVEYHDPDPCAMVQYKSMRAAAPTLSMLDGAADMQRTASLGVKIEARYTVGEYDILILSAQQSGGLETWLVENGYRVPPGARRVLGSYIKQGMKFFVAKVNLKERQKLGFSNLRPIQVAYESPKFMLPIRLGMVNADGAQELFVYTLTRRGRVETTNYRTVKLPSDVDVPVFVKDEFADFYRAMFTHQVGKQGMEVVFTEYAWDMAWCDPCASDPLSTQELRELGVFWIDENVAGGRVFPGGPQNAFVTRLHVRYDAAHFPEDLVFQETADRNNFQGRYVLRHEWKGTAECDGAKSYRAQLPERRAREARNLAELTGWSLERIRGKMAVNADWSAPKVEWWERLWKN
jgi:hypothetical protein